MKIASILIALVVVGGCSSSTAPIDVPILDAPQIAVGQAWQEMERRSVYSPKLTSLDQKRILSEFDKLTNPNGDSPLNLDFGSRPDFVLSVKGESFKELEALVPLVGKPADASRWHVYGAWINAIARSFDDRSSFYPPNRQDDVSSMVSAAADGIGLSLTSLPGGGVAVGSVSNKGPSDKAGVAPGMRLLGVSEHGKAWQDVRFSSAYEAQSLLRGPTGTKVRLRLARDGKVAKVFNLRREKWWLDEDRVRLRSIKGEAILVVPRFYVDVDPAARWNVSTQKDVDFQLDQLDKRKMFILDLRGNPGGVLEQALEVGGLLGVEGKPWKIHARDVTHEQVVIPSRPQLPSAVWVDGRTGSSAEILAGALQVRGVPVIGVATFGKTTLQLLVPLDHVSMVKDGQSKTGNLLFTTARVSWGQGNSEHVDPDCLVPEGIAQDVDARYLNTMHSCNTRPELK